MKDLTGFQRDLLLVAAGLDGSKGLEIKEHLDDYYTTEINHGRLYPNLNELVDDGLVDKGSIDDRTNSYTITDEGRELLEDHREWQDEQIADLEIEA